MPRRNAPENFFPRYGAAHGHAQEPTPGSAVEFWCARTNPWFRGRILVCKDQPLVPRSNFGVQGPTPGSAVEFWCARTNPWFRGRTLPVPGHGGRGVHPSGAAEGTGCGPSTPLNQAAPCVHSVQDKKRHVWSVHIYNTDTALQQQAFGGRCYSSKARNPTAHSGAAQPTESNRGCSETVRGASSMFPKHLSPSPKPRRRVLP